MAVWKEPMDEVITDLHVFSGAPALTMRGVFTALTEAQHQLQMETGAVRKRMDVALSGMDASGYLPISGLVHVIDRAEYLPVGATTPDPEEIFVVDEESLLAFIRRGRPAQTGAFMIGHEQDEDKVRVYPTSARGTLRLHYQPKLKRFSASETEQWPGYDADFKTKIATEGPETKFQSVIPGLVAKAKLMLVTRIPGAKAEFASEMPMWVADWRAAIESVSRSNVKYGMNTNPDPYWAPVK